MKIIVLKEFVLIKNAMNKIEEHVWSVYNKAFTNMIMNKMNLM